MAGVTPGFPSDGAFVDRPGIIQVDLFERLCSCDVDVLLAVAGTSHGVIRVAVVERAVRVDLGFGFVEGRREVGCGIKMISGQ